MFERFIDRVQGTPIDILSGDVRNAGGGPFAEVRFCPTGGITLENARDYLALPNVACVGGSWVAPAQQVEAGDWDGITTLAAQAAALRST